MNEKKSDLFARYRYDEETKELQIEFHSGYHVYRYHDIPKDVVESFLREGSHGAFFNKKIRNRYTCEKVGVKEEYERNPHYAFLK
ncbi:KTSC domain-containing protein (plasmid) [Pontibacillus sp. ALD_SL1]|uniref:KTSC domain-containing protein n=1 Tax=Pontibacillus sp. ALD_SL1 TaxID=2777185 RepID=UPI001A95A4DC|nr:KTSC domain-containing protein [Pontibacillus sp. ALD_SL1]QST02657.1 KTSC domain-containing protein [Pontibacillus sp. ALD_SL1]